MREESGDGILHWMVGMSGKALYPTWRSQQFSDPQPPDAPPNDWVAARDATFFGYSTIEVFNSSRCVLRVFCTERSPAGAPGACDPDVPLDEYWMTNQLVYKPLPSASPTISVTPSPSATVSVTQSVASSTPSASATPSISVTPSSSLSLGSTPSTTPSVTATASPTPSASSSPGASAIDALAAARSAEGPLEGRALGAGVGVGLLVAVAIAASAVYLSELRRRAVKDRVTGASSAASAGSTVVINEFGARKPAAGVSV